MPSEIKGSSNFDSDNAGKVLQVVSTSDTAEQILATTSWIDTNLSLSITPSATTSKIRLDLCFPYVYFKTEQGLSFRFVRNGTSIFTPATPQSSHGVTGRTEVICDMAIDEPATTSPITYKVQVAGFATGTIDINNNGEGKSNFIATEIGV